MRTFLAESAASAGPDSPSPLKRWLFSGTPAALRYGARRGCRLVGGIVLAPVLHDQSPYLLFVPAVLVAAGWADGARGLRQPVSRRCSVCSRRRRPHISAAEIATAIAFLLIGVGVAWSGEQLQRNRLRAAANARQAVAREAHLTSILDTVPDAMVVIDERGIINPSARQPNDCSAYAARKSSVRMSNS